MAKGRKPKPPEIHERSGAYEKDPQRRKKNLPPPMIGEPMKPPSVSGDDIASEKWDETSYTLSQLGLLSASYSDMLESYCVAYSLYRRSLDQAKSGITVKTKSGTMRNPALIELHKCLDTMTKLQAEMGLTPASRSRVSVVDADGETDPVLELLRKRSS